jgi:hypothetical protein
MQSLFLWGQAQILTSPELWRVNSQNTQCIAVVKIFTFLEREQKLTFFKGFLTVEVIR